MRYLAEGSRGGRAHPLIRLCFLWAKIFLPLHPPRGLSAPALVPLVAFVSLCETSEALRRGTLTFYFLPFTSPSVPEGLERTHSCASASCGRKIFRPYILRGG